MLWDEHDFEWARVDNKMNESAFYIGFPSLMYHIQCFAWNEI